jgi:ATP synthase protein I
MTPKLLRTQARRLGRAKHDPLLYSRRVNGSALNDIPRLGYIALFSEIGLVLFVTTMAGALAGHWLDLQLGTNPIFVVVGFLAGAGLGAAADYRLITKFLDRLN